MKLGISMYSFHAYKADDKLGYNGCMDFAAEIGCQGMDFVEFAADGVSGKERHAAQLKLAKQIGDGCRDRGMQAVCYCTGGNFLYRDKKLFDAEIQRLKKEVDIAAALGCGLMRHDCTHKGFPPEVKFGRGFDDCLDILSDGYREVTQYAQQFGIVTCAENHGFFVQDAQRMEKLANRVAHSNFGLLTDIGNFSVVDENNSVSVGVVAPYTVHAHAKDFHLRSGSLDNPGKGFGRTRGGNYFRGAVLGQGDVFVKTCLSVLKNSGYEGFMSLEFEGMEDPLTGIRIGFENLKRYLTEI